MRRMSRSSTMCVCADNLSWTDSGQAGVCMHSGQCIYYLPMPDPGDTGDLSLPLQDVSVPN